jgi:hypothetical protein
VIADVIVAAKQESMLIEYLFLGGDRILQETTGDISGTLEERLLRIKDMMVRARELYEAEGGDEEMLRLDTRTGVDLSDPYPSRLGRLRKLKGN